ncbi:MULTISPECIES: multidrug effflux MFS transporter [Shewanella]|uniref:Bcr/CflA family efflux transporter n=1 Tax=Shewanella fidelis TaxID=173509 RepID=A0AAW8NQT2_9GAMM|nr:MULTISPECIES: multidrug effflux MFS transporter [Shewanella]MDR8525569.1 multidrug effflux MFS transporter [Shewanella fidelis]MDW4813112.1 multidrug effflux MFS transporter [Shewanella fidelis]MDW4817008.1 multidrug effflux MFS transporter [Shewanella fidelis]MDW4820167.1 multidrug effflux MFS transporter [Shewanella fidelis]MDW4825577.1 multidrug effflux MFS transporter [Shewanella fidelis]
MRRSLLPILLPLVILSPLAIDIYLPSMPTMAAEFSVSASEIQSTLVLFLFAMGTGQLLIGPLADRFGRRPVALGGIVFYIISSVLAAIAAEFHWLQIARVMQGLAACSTSIVVFSAVRDCFSPKEGARYYSYLNGMICIIPALAPTLGGMLALQFGWRSNFIFMALYGLIILALVVFRLPETRPQNTVSDGPLYRWARYKPVISEPHFVFYALACMAGMAAIISYVSYAPVWLIGHLGVSELVFSGLFGLNAAVNIIACFAAPLVIKKLGNRPTVITALGLMLASALAQVVVQVVGPQAGLMAAYSYMLPMMLLCIGFALLLGPATSMALSAFGERAGTATAMLGFIQMSGASLIAALIQQTSLSAPYAVALLMGGLSSLLLMVMAMRKLDHWHQEQHAY